LRLGTRGSPLALAQARQLRERCGRTAVLVTVTTPGDESTAPIDRLGTTGMFTTTLREALLRGTVDLVVHSGKTCRRHGYRNCRWWRAGGRVPYRRLGYGGPARAPGPRTDPGRGDHRTWLPGRA
jgi:hypothetical protein